MAKDFVAWSKRRDSEIHRLGCPSDNDGGVSCNRYGYAPKRLQKAVVDVRRRYNEVLDPIVELSSPPIGNLSATVEGSGLNIAVNERFRDSGFVNCKDDRVLNSFLPEIVAAGAREKSWQIHKTLACCHSKWFQKAVTGDFEVSGCKLKQYLDPN